MSFDPALVRSGARQRSLQRPAARRRARTSAATPASGAAPTARTDRCSRRTRTTSRRASASPGTSPATARPRCAAGSASSTCASASVPVCNIGDNPPFVTVPSGIRTLDTTAPPCDGCFGNSRSARPTSGREQAAPTPNNWQWNLVSSTRSCATRRWRVGYVGNKGDDLLTQRDINQVLPGDINRNGVDDRLEYAASGEHGARAPCGRSACSATGASLSGTTAASRSTTRCRRRSSAASGAVAVPGVVHLVAARRRTTRSTTATAAWPATWPTLDLQNPGPRLRPGANIDRPHIFNTSLVLVLPTLEDGVGRR